MPEIHKILETYLPKVANFIEGYKSDVPYEFEFKPSSQPSYSFGLTRIEALKFMKSIIKLGVVDYAINFTTTCRKLLEFCVEYEWNSALHKLTEDILTDILRSNSKYEEGFRTAFIDDTSLVQFLASMQKNSTHEKTNRPV